MPLTFPTTPTAGQQSTQNGRLYQWSGTAWEFVPTVTGHKGSHIVGGTDAISPADIGAAAAPDQVITVAASGNAQTLAPNYGTIYKMTNTSTVAIPLVYATLTLTMPAASAGKRFVLMLTGTATTQTYVGFTPVVKWPNNTAYAPTVWSGTGGFPTDVISFFSDGVFWYGRYDKGYL